MIDDIDRASEREAEILGDALRDHTRRAGLAGKTVADSAEYCEADGCGEPIPQRRRETLPGCRYCVHCQERREKTTNSKRARA